MRPPWPSMIVNALLGFAIGLLFRHFWDNPLEATVANYLRSGLHGSLIGVVSWGSFSYLNVRASRWLRRLPLLAEIAVRAALMTIAIGAVIVGAQLAIYNSLSAKWFFTEMPGIIAVAFVFTIVGGAIYELVRLIGARTLLDVILGRYRNPTREDRVLMFLDLAGSTSLAERLGEVRMQELLTRFFFDIDAPIVAHGGEVHAYVGDEVIVSWPLTKEPLGGRCVDCFFAVLDRIEEHAESYRSAFGSIPRFRAALHAGPVVISECGDSRRQIAYFGDTMNVTARLQEHCKAAGRNLLVSADLLRLVRPGPDLLVLPLGPARLRGRSAEVEVFAVERGAPPGAV